MGAVIYTMKNGLYEVPLLIEKNTEKYLHNSEITLYTCLFTLLTKYIAQKAQAATK